MAELSLSALLHLVYAMRSLRVLSLVCFYSNDTIKFNALMSACRAHPNLRVIELAQLRKDAETLYSLSKLFQGKGGYGGGRKVNSKNRKAKAKERVQWNFCASLTVSFGVAFRYFYYGERVETHHLCTLLDRVGESAQRLAESKQNLLRLSQRRCSVEMPSDVWWICVEFALGVDGDDSVPNVRLLCWDL